MEDKKFEEIVITVLFVAIILVMAIRVVKMSNDLETIKSKLISAKYVIVSEDWR